MEDGSTEVKGGLVMTNVMLLKNAEGDVTAGVSGLQEDDVPFWSGADYTNRKKAVFRVHADGGSTRNRRNRRNPAGQKRFRRGERCGRKAEIKSYSPHTELRPSRRFWVL